MSRGPRLLICANSVPAPTGHPGESLRGSAAGGLVPHILALLDRFGGEWYFPADGSTVDTWAGAGPARPVGVDPRAQAGHYGDISVETLLWLMHYLHDTAGGPAFDHRRYRAWAGYEEVNRRMADAVAAGTDPGGADVVLVTDYHLMLMPGYLAGRLPAGTRVVYAHQVPWCEPGYFGILPGDLRVQILRSLLAADVLVFHATGWLRAFARCCAAYLPGSTSDDDGVGYAGRRTRLRAVPFPVDAGTVLGLRDAAPTRRWRDRIAAHARGRRLLVRVDRLDLWKNHLLGFAAFEELLRYRPELHGELCFLAVVAPTRHRSTRHVAYEAGCRDWAERLNAPAHAAGRPEPVTLLYPEDPAESRHRAIAALSLADGVLVNSTWDGFNLVAKEALLASTDPAVLLARTTGAFESLEPAVTALDPFDVRATAAALGAVLFDGDRPDPVQVGTARDAARADTPAAWLTAALR